MINGEASAPVVLLSIATAAILLFFVFRLITRQRKRYQLFEQIPPDEILRPFPQAVSYPTGMRLPQVQAETARQVVRVAYADWLQKLMLPDQEPGQSFVRMGVEKHNLRYQVLATSFGQALGILFSVVMAGDDLLAHQRFERLLAYCLSHPAADDENLTSWQNMPDLRTGRRQEADPHAEAWVGLVLSVAPKQWRVSSRFDLAAISQDRLPALLNLYNRLRQRDPQPYLLSSPAFWRVFAQTTGNSDWETLGDALLGQSADLICKEDLFLTGSASVEEAQLALQILNLGLDVLWSGKQTHKNLSGKLLRLAQAYVDGFKPSDLSDLSLETQGQFGALAQLACCAPIVMALGDQDLVDQLWQKLTSIETSKFDPIGISLRLLSLMLLADVLWPLSDQWQAEETKAS